MSTEAEVRAKAEEFYNTIAAAVANGLHVTLPSAWQNLKELAISETGKVRQVVSDATSQVRSEANPQGPLPQDQANYSGSPLSASLTTKL